MCQLLENEISIAIQDGIFSCKNWYKELSFPSLDYGRIGERIGMQSPSQIPKLMNNSAIYMRGTAVFFIYFAVLAWRISIGVFTD